MKAFLAKGDSAVAELDPQERLVIARVVADVGLLLGSEPFESPQPQDIPDEHAELFAHLSDLEESLTEPDDPATLRLLPNASPDDRELSDEFRRLTERELRATKTARLRRVWEQLSEEGLEWVVPREEVLDVAAALTDVRLVLASRLGLDDAEGVDRFRTELELAHHAISTGADDQLGVDPQRAWLGMLYESLTWLQDTLVTFDENTAEGSEGTGDE